MEFLNRLFELDKQLVIRLNSHWNQPALDFLFQHIRETYFWIPLYLFFLVLAVQNFGKKSAWWILFAICTIAITDQVSSNLIKNSILRTRPCNDPDIVSQVRMFIRYCPGSSSFTSSHATNHFGFASFVVFSTRQVLGKWVFILFFFAALVATAQVYVAVHYPIDVLAGGLLGLLLGSAMSSIFNRYIGRLQPTSI